jgi:hypothetical protein
LVTGLRDAFENDFMASGRDKKEIDFSCDDEILQVIG